MALSTPNGHLLTAKAQQMGWTVDEQQWQVVGVPPGSYYNKDSAVYIQTPNEYNTNISGPANGKALITVSAGLVSGGSLAVAFSHPNQDNGINLRVPDMDGIEVYTPPPDAPPGYDQPIFAYMVCQHLGPSLYQSGKASFFVPFDADGRLTLVFYAYRQEGSIGQSINNLQVDYALPASR